MEEVQIGHGQDGMNLERLEWLFLTCAADTVFQDWDDSGSSFHNSV